MAMKIVESSVAIGQLHNQIAESSVATGQLHDQIVESSVVIGELHDGNGREFRGHRKSA